MRVNLANFSAVVSDIDYTLVDFDKGHQAAIKALAQLFGKQFADEVNRVFYLILERLRRSEDADWQEMPVFQEVMDQIH